MTAADDDDDDGGPGDGGLGSSSSSSSRRAMLQVLKRVREADAAAPLDPEQALVASLAGKMTLSDDDEDEEEEEEGEESSGGEEDDDLDLDGDLDEGDVENLPLPLEDLGITLSVETSRRLRELDREHAGSADGPPEEAVFAALSEEERVAFLKVVAAKEGEREGEEEEKETWLPWWQASDSDSSLNNNNLLLNLPALSKDGTALVSEIGRKDEEEEEEDDDDDDEDDSSEESSEDKRPSPSSSIPPPPPQSPLPRLASLLPARANGIPAPGIESTVVCALYGYCWAVRRCQGGGGEEWRRKKKKGGGEGEGVEGSSNAFLLPFSPPRPRCSSAGSLSRPPQPGVLLRPFARPWRAASDEPPTT